MANLGLSQAANNFVNAYAMGKQQKQQQQEQEKNEQVNSLLGGMLMGTATPDQSQQLAEMAPNQFLSAQNYLQNQAASAAAAQDVMSQEEDIADLTYLLSTDDTAAQDAYLQKRINTITERGGDPRETNMLLSMPADQRSKAIEMLAAQNNIKRPAGDKFEQGTGDMSGYVFNASKGTYEADQATLDRLATEAAEEAKKEGILTGKDLAGVNDKVTNLVSGAQDIVAAAQSLEALEANSTPAAQLAAVFKFMKANDPTSTVREGEQGQVYAAEGAMKGFAAQINQMLGKGGLSEENFNDLVNTAKVMANSAVGSTNQTVGSYLTVLEDSLSAKSLKDLQSRVPPTFKVTETPKESPKYTDDAMSEVDSIMKDLGL
jgi:hypothetical protein